MEPTEIFLVNTYGDKWERWTSRQRVAEELQRKPDTKVRRSVLKWEDFDTSELRGLVGPFVYRFKVHFYGAKWESKTGWEGEGVYDVVSDHGGYRYDRYLAFLVAESIGLDGSQVALEVTNLRRTKETPWTDKKNTLRAVKPIQRPESETGK